MYDTISSFIVTPDKLNLHYLKNLVEVTNYNSREIILKGDLGNLKIKKVFDGITIYGSLAKYYYGNNLQTLDRLNTQKAIEKLSDELLINFNNSRIYRLDIAFNMFMDQPIKDYFKLLGNCPYLHKSNFGSSIYYTNSKKQIVFYDKILEMKTKKIDYVKDFTHSNVIRIELRYKKRLKDQMNRNVTMQDLYDKEFYNLALTKWRSSYFSINKTPNININKMKDATSKNFKEYIFSILMNEKGINNILDIIDANRSKFKSSIEASRLKADLKRISANKIYSEEHELIKEMDGKVNLIF